MLQTNMIKLYSSTTQYKNLKCAVCRAIDAAVCRCGSLNLCVRCSLD